MIFLSYSWNDREYALDICARLRSARLTYWLDSEHLDLDSALHPQLSTAIDCAAAVLLVDSRASRASRWVEFEHTVAASRQKPTMLLPVE